MAPQVQPSSGSRVTSSITSSGVSDSFPSETLKSLDALKGYLKHWDLQAGDDRTKAIFIFKPSKQFSDPLALRFEWDATAKRWQVIPNSNSNPVDAPPPGESTGSSVSSSAKLAQQANGAINRYAVYLATDLGLPAAVLAHVVPASAVTNLNEGQVGALISFNANGVHPYISVDYARGKTVTYDPALGKDPNDYSAKATGDTYQSVAVAVGLESRAGKPLFIKGSPWFVSRGVYDRVGIGYRWTQISTGRTVHEIFTESMPELFAIGKVTSRGAWFTSISPYIPLFNPNRQAVNALGPFAGDNAYLGLSYIGAMVTVGHIPGWTETTDYDRLAPDSPALMKQHLFNNALLGLNTFMQTRAIITPAIDTMFDELTHGGSQANYNTAHTGLGLGAILNAGNDVRRQRALTQVWLHGSTFDKALAGVTEGLFVLGYGIGTILASTNRYPTTEEARMGFSGILADHNNRTARIQLLPEITNVGVSGADAGFLRKQRPLWAHFLYQGGKALTGIGMVWYAGLATEGVTGGDITSYSVLGDGNNFNHLSRTIEGLAQYDLIGKKEWRTSVGQAGMAQIYSAGGGILDIPLGNVQVKKSDSSNEKPPTGYAEVQGTALTPDEEVRQRFVQSQAKRDPISLKLALAPDRGGAIPVQGGFQLGIPLDRPTGRLATKENIIGDEITRLKDQLSLLETPLKMATEAKLRANAALEAAAAGLQNDPNSETFKRQFELAQSSVQSAQQRLEQLSGQGTYLQAQIDGWKSKLASYYPELKSAEVEPTKVAVAK